MQLAERTQRTWIFPRILVEDYLSFTALVWAGLLIFTFVTTYVVSLFRDISISAWEVAAGAAPWFLGFMSGFLMYQVVPMFIANGRTRRDTFIEWLIFGGLFATLAALLMTVGFLVEYVVYGIADWPRTLENDHMFATHTDVVPMFGELLLTYLVWVAAGGFIGVSLYRSEDLGWLSIIPGFVLVGIVGSFSRTSLGPFGFITHRFPDFTTSNWLVAIPTALVCCAIAVWAAWSVIRELPLRSK